MKISEWLDEKEAEGVWPTLVKGWIFEEEKLSNENFRMAG